MCNQGVCAWEGMGEEGAYYEKMEAVSAKRFCERKAPDLCEKGVTALSFSPTNLTRLSGTHG